MTFDYPPALRKKKKKQKKICPFHPTNPPKNPHQKPHHPTTKTQTPSTPTGAAGSGSGTRRPSLRLPKTDETTLPHHPIRPPALRYHCHPLRADSPRTRPTTNPPPKQTQTPNTHAHPQNARRPVPERATDGNGDPPSHDTENNKKPQNKTTPNRTKNKKTHKTKTQTQTPYLNHHQPAPDPDSSRS